LFETLLVDKSAMILSTFVSLHTFANRLDLGWQLRQANQDLQRYTTVRKMILIYLQLRYTENEKIGKQRQQSWKLSSERTLIHPTSRAFGRLKDTAERQWYRRHQFRGSRPPQQQRRALHIQL
jgi:hypothetical protein